MSETTRKNRQDVSRRVGTTLRNALRIAMHLHFSCVRHGEWRCDLPCEFPTVCPLYKNLKLANAASLSVCRVCVLRVGWVGCGREVWRRENMQGQTQGATQPANSTANYCARSARQFVGWFARRANDLASVAGRIARSAAGSFAVPDARQFAAHVAEHHATDAGSFAPAFPWEVNRSVVRDVIP